MGSGSRNILISALTIAIIAVVFSLVTTGSFEGLFLILLGMTLGPYMGVAYPFSFFFKVGYILALLCSVILFVFGIKRRQEILGSISVVIGVVLWAFTGLVGLGTGT